ncbi:Gfo/Idh/MocA family oxidoreductase [Marinobacter sp. TBZ242]|uniref:Gfo/Idh/MocA family oxidoreductase n=1 Tax=Marinobacter azerbaijanicus TaxID=3050455 RepID=A0ABT7I6V8_9GAMM|nr:Gfo/Idh/MocA family oxidoreductase [Marinobacter sp. TBZ242]MDL0429773.1 Gfo/Idh/MocA family oxidoreductase [Marinobacter sp. TBZ242]
MMRFGLIGLGGIGEVRKKALEVSDECELTAAFDLDANVLVQLPDDVTVFKDAEQLLKSDACDAVIISTPTHFHKDLAITALENGKHVIVEKPMASSLAECEQMVETAERCGKILTVGFNHRYFAAIKEVKAAIQNEALGTLRYVKGYAGHTGLSEFKSAWMYDKDKMGGGTLMDNGIHTLDLICYLINDEINEVSGMISTKTWQLDRTEDNAFVQLRSQSGVMGSLHSSWTEWKGYHFYVEAYGDLGMARAYYAPMSSTIITMDKLGGQASKKRNFYIPAIFREKFKGWQSTVVQTFVEEFHDFVSMTNGGPAGAIATAKDGLRSIAIPNAVYDSDRDHRVVTLNRPG